MDNLTKSLEEATDRMLKSKKPKIIAARFKDEDIDNIDEEKIKHFRSAEYLWQLTPIQEGNDAGLHLGLLMDETLNYIHLVLASQKFYEYTFQLKNICMDH